MGGGIDGGAGLQFSVTQTCQRSQSDNAQRVFGSIDAQPLPMWTSVERLGGRAIDRCISLSSILTRDGHVENSLTESRNLLLQHVIVRHQHYAANIDGFKYDGSDMVRITRFSIDPASYNGEIEQGEPLEIALSNSTIQRIRETCDRLLGAVVRSFIASRLQAGSTENAAIIELDRLLQYPEFRTSVNQVSEDRIQQIFDELHPINTNAFLTIRSDAWWSNDTTIIPVSSFFGPVIRLSTLEYLTGSSGEIVSQPLTIYNEGTQTVYLDSFSIPAPFSYEPFEEDHIDSGDSLVIDLITVLEDFPYWNQESGILSLSNFNTINYGINLISMRYFELGDQIYNGWSGLLNRNNPNCNVTSSTWNFSDPVGMFNNLNFYSIEQFYTNVHHFDFGFSNSENLEMYAQQLDSLYLNFRDNSRFVSLIGMDTDQHSALTWPSNSFEDCNSLNMQFDDEDSPVFFQDIFSEHLFPDWVESVIIDQQGVITYIDTFNLETLKTAIEEEIGECGYDCLPDNAINLPSDTIEFSIQLGGVATDTLLLENITDHTIGYNLEWQPGILVEKSIIFNSDLDRLNAPGNNNISMNLNAPLSLSFWFKTIGSNWSTDGVPTTFIAPSEFQTDFDPTNYWRIILTNDEDGFPKIGWIDEDSYFLAATPIYEGDWFHFALVIDEMSQNLGIYINGNLEVDEALLNDIPTISNLRINEDSQNLFSGFLSQTASWNTALSASEISYIKDMGPDAELRSNNGRKNQRYNSKSH